MIQVNGVTKQFGPQILFENISFNMGKGEKIGLVGRNGTGKSTLIKIINGQEFSDAGSVSIPKNYKIGSLEQHIKFFKDTLLDEVASILSEEEKFDTYKVEKILFGLGFNKDDLEKNPLNFSGGYQLRINLAKVLLKNPDLLLLDEPTNYLDIVSMRWLSKFLKSFLGEMIIITHDREFMDSVTSHTMGIINGTLKKLAGPTVKFFEKIELEEVILEKARINQDKKRQVLENFVERFGAKASKASQAQSKLKQIEKMEQIEGRKTERDPYFSFEFLECPGKEVFNAKELSFSYNSNGPLLIDQFSLNVLKKDRIAIIGKNGRGKSTLLNLLSNELVPLKGELSFHPKSLMGHFGQTNVNRLNENHTIFEEIFSSNNTLSVTRVRGIAGALMFSGEMAEKKIKVLSGGEKARVLLGKIMAKATNLLFLDEPTNHLDIESIEILQKEIEEFPGAVIMITHNEGLIRNFAKKLVVFQNGKVDIFDGTYDEFLDKIGWEDEDDRPKNKKASGKEKNQTIESQAQKTQMIVPIKKEILTLEENIIKLEKYRDLINKELIDASKNGDAKKIEASSIRINEIDSKIDELFLELEEKMSHLQILEKDL